MMRYPSNTTLQIQLLRPTAQIPQFATPGSSGMDLHACIEGDGVIGIPPRHRVLIPTGLALEIEPGWEGQIRSRSGLALKHGISVLNSPGTIDSDFRGELKVILMNHEATSFVVRHGDRIAQLVLTTIAQQTAVKILVMESLSSSARGEGGFGSTGG